MTDKRGTVAAEVTLAKWGSGYVANEIWIDGHPYAIQVNPVSQHGAGKDKDGAMRLVLIHHWTLWTAEVDQPESQAVVAGG